VATLNQNKSRLSLFYEKIMADAKLEQIDERLQEIDVEIGKLQTLRRRLIAQREKLSDKSNFEKSEALAAKNKWNDGKLFFLCSSQLILIMSLIYRGLSVVKNREGEVERCLWFARI
jgi:predicted nuclease with TOPRIM domain